MSCIRAISIAGGRLITTTSRPDVAVFAKDDRYYVGRCSADAHINNIITLINADTKNAAVITSLDEADDGAYLLKVAAIDFQGGATRHICIRMTDSRPTQPKPAKAPIVILPRPAWTQARSNWVRRCGYVPNPSYRIRVGSRTEA